MGEQRVLRLWSAPWLRAPLLLVRRPVVFVGLVVATGVLAIASSAGVLFASTLGTASLRAQAGDECPEHAMPTFSIVPDPAHLRAANRSGVAAMRAADIARSPYWVDLTGTYIQNTQVTLFSRPGALRHVRTLTPDRGQPGAWLPDDFAAKLNLRPGDTAPTTFGSIHVAGIYRSLSPDPFHLTALPRYWCTWSGIIVHGITANGPAAPPLLIADPATVAATAAAYGTRYDVIGSGASAVPTGLVLASWYAPLPLASTSLARARDVLARLPGAQAATGPLAPDTSADLADTVRYGPLSGPPPPIPLAGLVDRAQRVQDGLTGSVLPVSIAGALVALLLVCEAGGSWAAHGSREIRLLASRGSGPVAIGAKAFLETLPAGLAGLAVGYAASYFLMRALGPAAAFGPGVALHALLIASGAVLAGLILVAALGGQAARDGRGASAGRWARFRPIRSVPVELAFVGAGLWSWLRIRAGRGIDFDHAIVDVHPLLLVFPLLALTGALLFTGRLAAFAVPRLGPAARRLARAGFLAVRRIGGSRAITVGLLIGTALPCGLLAYAGTISTGVQHEVVRKYQTNLGAPHVLMLTGVHEADPALDGHGTAVARYVNGPVLPGGAPVSVLGIDPATFGAFAFVDGTQRRDVGRLAARASGGTPAILVNAPAGLDPSRVRIGASRVPIAVIAHRDIFPGLSNGSRPLLVVDRAALAHVDPRAGRTNEVWTDAAQLAAVSAAIDADGYRVLSQSDTQIRVSNSGLLPITWIFGYLRALAILVGAVAVAGLAFALSARTRRRRVAYAMSRRMGLTAGTHLRSLLIELGAVVGLGWLAGTAAGVGGYALLAGSLDVQPQLPPGAALELPALSLAVTASVVALVVVIAAVGAHVGAERAHPAEILRLA